MKTLRIILTAATVFMMALIFWFSAQPADDSSEMSTSVGLVVGHIFVSGFDDKPEAEQMTYAESIDYPVRKCAHATEYAVLSALCICTLFSWSYSKSIKDKNSNNCIHAEDSGIGRSLSAASPTSRCLTSKNAIPLIIGGWLIATLYAATDEFHQLFVDGRACLFKDVMIDSAGAAFAAIVILLIVIRSQRSRAGD